MAANDRPILARRVREARTAKSSSDATMGPGRRMPKTPLRAYRILGALALGLLALVELTPATEWLAARYAEPERIEAADAIVALGGSVGPDGWLDTPSWRRLAYGVLLYRRGLAPLLVLSGSVQDVGPTEPEVRARIARASGVPPDAILPVTATTTRTEAQNVGAQLRARGARSVLLVTGSFHLVRARAVFERQGFAVHPAPVEEVSLRPTKPGERLRLTQALAREVLGWLYYRLAGYM